MAMRRLLRLAATVLLGAVACKSKGVRVVQQKGAAIERFYLYSTEGVDFSPVIDYHGDKKISRPSFLFDPGHGNRIVEFYQPWCPHCRHFRPKFVAFGKLIRKLAQSVGSDIEVHAVSCGVYKNVCMEAGAKSFPKVILIKAGEIKRVNAPQPVVTSGLQILRMFGIPVNATIEKELEKFKAYAAQTQKNVTLKFNSSNPFFKRLREAHQNGTAVKFQLRRGKGGVAQLVMTSAAHNQSNTHEQRRETKLVPKRTQEQVFDDAFLSLDFALRDGIFTSTSGLEDSAKESFKSWLLLLEVALPQSSYVQDLVRELLDKFDDVVESEVNLLEVVDRYPPKSSDWSPACTKEHDAAGYTCGLWQLFHIVTVGVVEWNVKRQNESLPTGGLQRVDEAAVTLRNYVQHFFGCQVCRENFVKSFDACGHDRCNRLSADASTWQEWMQLPLWLSETHNAVNRRLLHEKAERDKIILSIQDEVNVLWPSRQDCPTCWKHNGRFRPENVYRHLKSEYWPQRDEVQDEGRVLSVLARRNLLQEDRGKFSFSLLMLILGLSMSGVVWYTNSAVRRRTGLHKKRDSFP